MAANLPLRPHLPPQAPPRAAYVHVPFCAHRCGYCNFTVVANRPDLTESYLEAMARELAWLGLPRPVDTLYFGGGTPTQLSTDQLGRLLETVLAWHPLTPGGELTVEANPADLSGAKLKLLAAYGTTRISLGAQSFDAAKLEFLQRDHRARHIREACDAARHHIEQVALDLIYAVPDETLSTWSADLAAAVASAADHLSIYGLTIEKGAPFYGHLRRRAFREVVSPLQRSMLALAIDQLGEAGFEHYEISSFAQPGKRCRHNETYWLGEGYFAAGPGAARYVGGQRSTNHRSTSTYLRRVLAGASPIAQQETLPPEDRARERLVFALRRLEGVDRQAFAAATGYEIDALVGGDLVEFVRLGLMTDDRKRVRLTRAGLFVSDAIWPHFL
jgi:oxygen-independent coproporphyrinogen-3 oxidase